MSPPPLPWVTRRAEMLVAKLELNGLDLREVGDLLREALGVACALLDTERR